MMVQRSLVLLILAGLLTPPAHAHQGRNGDEQEVERPGDDQDHDSGSGSGSGSGDSRFRARSPLVRADGSVDDNAKGRIEVRSKGNRQRLVINAERLQPGLEVELFVENQAGTLELIERASVNNRGQVRVRFDTKKVSLPFALSVLDLAGHEVIFKTAQGGQLLTGIIPERRSSLVRHRERDELSNDDQGSAPNGKAKLRAEFRPAESRSKLKVELEHVSSGSTFELFVAHPETDVLTKVGEFTANSFGEAEIEFETNDGEALPFGVPEITALSGKAVEVRSPDGTVRFSGAIPSF